MRKMHIAWVLVAIHSRTDVRFAGHALFSTTEPKNACGFRCNAGKAANSDYECCY